MDANESKPPEQQAEAKGTEQAATSPTGSEGAAKPSAEGAPREAGGAPREPEVDSGKSAPGSGPDWTALAAFAGQALGSFLQEASKMAQPAAQSAAEATKRFAVDLDGGLDQAFAGIREQARDLMAKGQHTRVRIKFRGKQIAELPVAAVAAAEVASLWWFGPLRLILGHVVGKAVLEVEFVSNADVHVAEGRAHLADGEIEKALASFDLALQMDRRYAPAHLGRGVALKLRGDRAGARTAFEQAAECDPRGESGAEARRHLEKLGPA